MVVINKGVDDVTRFDEGRIAKIAGKAYNDNPYGIGFTKLGAVKLGDEGEEWLAGWQSAPRVSTAKEIAEANELTDLSRFRRKSNRYYK